MESVNYAAQREPWNKGKLVGQKPPLKLREIWAPDSALNAGPQSRTRSFRCGDRQQASGLRSSEIEGSGRLSW